MDKDHRIASIEANSPNPIIGESGLRSAIFEILRRHNVEDQCFAEVAMVLFAALNPSPAASSPEAGPETLPAVGDLIEVHDDDCEAMQRPRADCTCCPVLAGESLRGDFIAEIMKRSPNGEPVMTHQDTQGAGLREAAQFLLWQYDRNGPVMESKEAWETLRAALSAETGER